MSEPARRWLLGLLVAAGVCVVATPVFVVLVRGWVVAPYRVPSASMAPTLLIGDHVLAWKRFDPGALQRGTIVAFRYPKDRSVTYIKRVVGLPGDEIAFDDDRPLLTGIPTQQAEQARGEVMDDTCAAYPVKLLDEEIAGRTWTIARARKPGLLANAQKVVVPPGQLYVVGDNRDHSQDSRAWGFVPIGDVIGTVDRIWWSWDPCRGEPRTQRTGPVR